MAGGPESADEAVHDQKNPLITDPSDPQLTALRKLRTESGRAQSGKYIIEGIRHLARAFEEGVPIDLMFVEPSTLSNPFGQKLAKRLRQSGTPCIRLAPRLYRDITQASEPQGIGAVVRQQWVSFEGMKPGRDSFWLALESIDQPGNLGTIIRTAEAAGVSGIFLLGQGADPWDASCVRATMGAFFSQKLVRCSTLEFIEWARSQNVTVIGSSPAGLMDYRALRLRRPAVLLIGSEKQGLSQQLIDAATFMVRIPMRGGIDSINAAVAAGVLLFQFGLDAGRTGNTVNLEIRKARIR